ncbi:MAG: FeoB-associated Cys-rich membrane protein [Bacteroidaceae bacterium]|nr:FeoB-associated Cys-rich membrane protein [Bacteroidaceae bacterium]
MTQEIIVYIILAITLGVIIYYIFCQLTGKGRSCPCDSCPEHGGKCHCHEKKE